MNRLEKINERCQEYAEKPHIYDWVNGDHYIEDVSHLLQRLEIAQNELGKYISLPME
jgi:hypothetical protein